MTNTKNCKACKTKIHEEATKCPHCQSFQSSWSNWNVLIPIFLLLPLSIFLVNIMSVFDKADFDDYKEQVTFTRISEKVYQTKGGHDRIKIIGEIDNQSDKDWRMPEYKITFKNENGEFVHSAFESGIQTRVHAGTKTKTAVNVFVGTMNDSLTFEVELFDMKEEWQ